MSKLKGIAQQALMRKYAAAPVADRKGQLLRQSIRNLGDSNPEVAANEHRQYQAWLRNYAPKWLRQATDNYVTPSLKGITQGANFNTNLMNNATAAAPGYGRAVVDVGNAVMQEADRLTPAVQETASALARQAGTLVALGNRPEFQEAADIVSSAAGTWRNKLAAKLRTINNAAQKAYQDAQK